jgi:beta-lactamase class A
MIFRSASHAKAALAVTALMALAWAPLGHAAPNVPGVRAAAEADIARIAATGGGEVGVEAVNLKTGQALTLNAGDAFPMASVFKVAVAGAILAKVDAGALSLDQLVPVDPNLVLDSEGIAEIFPYAGVSVSVRNLLETMLTRSDNTAANVLTRLAGGPAAVTGWVRGQGVEGLRVDGDTLSLNERFYHVKAPPGVTLNAFLSADPSFEAREYTPDAQFDADPRDTATPDAIVHLLTRIRQGRALSPASTRLLLGVMERCTTGKRRIRAMLPPNTPVADKTGTIGGSVNDVGYVTLPDGRGTVAVAIFIKKSASDQREVIIAQIARSVYDYMAFASGSGAP